MQLLLIAAGGAAGAVSRYLVDVFVSERFGSAFPLGTLTVNLTGAFVAGLLFALAIERAVLPAEIRGPVMIGFLGAYTTFSTLMLEGWRLVEDGAIALAVANLAGSLLLGVVAVVLGLMLGRALA
jgi:CrcB protein